VVVGGETVDGLRAAIEQELRREDRATAVFSTSNIATLGAIKAIHGLQLTMPRDVSLLGFDDYEWMTALRPYVSAVAQPVGPMSAKAWGLLMQQRAHGQTALAWRPREHVRLAGELRIRESTGRSPRRP
jgi:LacI family transcriptional regulator